MYSIDSTAICSLLYSPQSVTLHFYHRNDRHNVTFTALCFENNLTVAHSRAAGERLKQMYQGIVNINGLLELHNEHITCVIIKK